jgi:hypothetical protein
MQTKLPWEYAGTGLTRAVGGPSQASRTGAGVECRVSCGCGSARQASREQIRSNANWKQDKI